MFLIDPEISPQIMYTFYKDDLNTGANPELKLGEPG